MVLQVYHNILTVEVVSTTCDLINLVQRQIMIQQKHSFHMKTFHTIDISFKEFNCSSWTSSTKKGDTAVDEICTNEHAQWKITHLSLALSPQLALPVNIHSLLSLNIPVCSLLEKPSP